MIVGKGVISERFIEYAQNNNFLVLSSDHSDSGKIENELEFENITQLINSNKDKCVVYFSTVLLYDKELAQSQYAKNHQRIEQLISKSANKYLICRVPTLVSYSPASQNDKTLINFLVKAIYQGEKFDLWEKAERNILDIDDLFFITDYLLQENVFRNKIVNIANPESVSVEIIVSQVEKFLNKSGNYDRKAIGAKSQVDVSEILPIINSLGIRFGEDYIQRLLTKYYSCLNDGPKKLSVVIPTYYAEEGIDEFHSRMEKVLAQLAPRFVCELIFVNDGSKDQTLPKLKALSKKDPQVKIINLSRNFGNQFAITAGIDKACGDAVVIIDDDLQDPPEIILNMIAVWYNGFDVVYGVRKKRSGINPLFGLMAKIYYRLMDYLSEVKIPIDTGDFRLIDRRALKHLRNMREENRYFRGMVSWIGFRQFGLYYDRDARFAGQSNFTLKRYFKFAFDGVSSFSEKPLFISSILGMLITTLGIMFGIWIIYLKFAEPTTTVPGWTSLVTILLFFGGIQLLSIGVLGLYIGKVFREVKKRPLYIVEEEIGFE